MSSINVPALLEGVLTATAAKAAAEARIAAYRAALEDEARRRYDTDGAAPSWTAKALGKVRLDPEGDYVAAVADPAAFESYVAEHHPTEANAVLRIPAARLWDALEALAFAGIGDGTGSGATVNTTVEVRPAWREPFLESLHVDVDRDEGGYLTVVAADSTGTIVPGITAHRTEAKLVVSLDRDRRTAVIEEARTEATEALLAALGQDGSPVDLEALDVRRRALEGLTVEQLGVIAKGHGLGSSGTKPALAERIARREAATGHIISPASTLEPSGADGSPAPAPEATTDQDDDPRERSASAHIARLEAAGSREDLRALAKRRGLSATGTKHEVALRLATDGATPADLTTDQEPTA